MFGVRTTTPTSLKLVFTASSLFHEPINSVDLQEVTSVKKIKISDKYFMGDSSYTVESMQDTSINGLVSKHGQYFVVFSNACT
jgi:hypothetical protein